MPQAARCRFGGGQARGELTDLLETADDGSLPLGGAVRDHRGRGVGRLAGGDQSVRELLQARDAHEDDERAGRLREQFEVELVVGCRPARDDRHLRGEAAVRQRNTRGRGYGRQRRHAGNHLGVDSRRHERVDLFAAAAEEEWVAALQAHDDLEAPTQRNQQLIHFGLAEACAREAESAPRHLVEQLSRCELVVHDRICPAEQAEAPHGDEVGVTGPCADEVDRHSSFSTSCSKNTRRSSYVA